MSTTIQELPDGKFDVQDAEGHSLLDPFGGPFYLRETAESTRRMLNGFDHVDAQVRQINAELRNV